jgi:hypothetical protein
MNTPIDTHADERTIPVTDRFYSELMEYLHPTERWMYREDGWNVGLVLYAPPNKRLIFVKDRQWQ